MMEKKIFISYSRMDKDQVLIINKCLLEVGYKVWVDNKITGGSKWWKNILDEIENNDIFIYIISKYSLESYACNEEFNYAHAQNKVIFPILLDQDVPIETLDPRISELQIVPISFSKNNDFTYDSIVDLWKGIVSLDLKNMGTTIPGLKRPEMPIEDVDRIGYEIINSTLIDQSRQLEIVEELKNLTHKAQFKKKAHENLIRLAQREDILFASVKESIEEIFPNGNIHNSDDIEFSNKKEWNLFDINGKSLIKIVNHLEDILKAEDFETSRVPIDGGGVGIRARKTNWVNLLTGSSSSIEFGLMQSGNQLFYKSGPSSQVWWDVTALSILTVATGGSGILITLVGLWNYGKIKKQVVRGIKTYLSN